MSIFTTNSGSTAGNISISYCICEMLNIIENQNLQNYSTMGVDAVADFVVEWETAADLHRLFTDPAYEGLVSHPVIPVGGCSNMLFVSPRLNTTLLRCVNGSVEELSSGGDSVLIRAAAGAVLDDVVAFSVDRGLWGMENLSMIPGTAGAAAVQNPGAYGVDFGDVVDSVVCYDRESGRTVTFDRKELNYNYRNSALKQPGMKGRMIVVSVTLALSGKTGPQLAYAGLAERAGEAVNFPAAMRRIVSEIRSAKLPDPVETPSCGSFFKNPIVGCETLGCVRELAKREGLADGSMPIYPAGNAPDGSQLYKLSAAWLIDKVGLKGYRRGNVALWPSQPLVVTNPERRASGQEIAAFAAEIADAVEAKWGVRLVPEVEYL